MKNDELEDFFFNAVFEIFYKNDNWIEYGDLLYQTAENVRDSIPEINIDTVEKWIKECILNDYISVARSQKDEITADDYCRGEWLGLDKE